jgi:CBS domain-containing protein
VKTKTVTLRTEKETLRVANFMSYPVFDLSSKKNFKDAIALMIEKGVGNIVVVENKKVLGIVTEREILQYLVLSKNVPNKLLKYILSQNFARVEPDTSILTAAETMIRKKTRLLVFQKYKTTKADRLVGIITASDLMRAFMETDRAPSLKGAMTNKVITIDPNSTILNAAKLMLKKRIGSVIVASDGSHYGIFTERDLLNRIMGQDIDIDEKVGQYCSIPVVMAYVGIRAREAARLMVKYRIKRLPLMKEGKIAAMVTARDLVEAFQRKQSEIDK